MTKPNIIIGNIISFIAAVFLIMGCIIKDKKKIYIFQILECLTLMVAYVFFESYSGMASLFISAFRNYTVIKNKYSIKVMSFFAVITIVLGLMTNNRGIIGIIPVAATVQYGICQKFCTTIIPIKIMIFTNVTLWSIYAFIVQDYPTALFNGIGSISCLVSMVYIMFTYRERR